VADAAVQAEILDQAKGPKLIHYVKRRRKHSSQRKKGHRQLLTVLRVTDILPKGAAKSGVSAAVGGVGAEAPAAVAAPKKTAPKQTAAKKPEPKKPAKAAAPVAADDLTALTGVGPAAATKLNAAGLTSYAQIAALGDDDIAAIGTIKIKPEWVEQAKELAKG